MKCIRTDEMNITFAWQFSIVSTNNEKKRSRNTNRKRAIQLARSPAVARVGFLYPKASVRLPVAEKKRFPRGNTAPHMHTIVTLLYRTLESMLR